MREEKFQPGDIVRLRRYDNGQRWVVDSVSSDEIGITNTRNPQNTTVLPPKYFKLVENREEPVNYEADIDAVESRLIERHWQRISLAAQALAFEIAAERLGYSLEDCTWSVDTFEQLLQSAKEIAYHLVIR